MTRRSLVYEVCSHIFQGATVATQQQMGLPDLRRFYSNSAFGEELGTLRGISGARSWASTKIPTAISAS